ncbi:MAG: phage holin family protein [Candidatus Azambacteria bacterium]|nr:phage holin family protein [Candidatus Azambacteria bacterium]
MRLIALVLGNVLALFLASYYIAGVAISGGLLEILIVGLVFSAVNFFLKPLLKLLLGPIILLTLGLFILAINMGVLWITDLLLPQMSIANVSALFLATLLVSAVNLATHIVFRK